jgi:hypothetical protein
MCTNQPPPAPGPAPEPKSREECWDIWRGNLHDPTNYRRNDARYIPGAREIQWAAWQKNPYTSFMEKQSGLAPVYQFPGRADIDQAEYLLSAILSKSWKENFKYVGGKLSEDPRFVVVERYKNKPIEDAFPDPFKDIDISLPCVQQAGGAPTPNRFPWRFNYDPKPEVYFNSCYPESPPDSPPDCSPRWYNLPADQNALSYNTQPHYCPNVEKIIEPSHPFSPRHLMTGMTDRDYSQRTSIKMDRKIRALNLCDDHIVGYTDYNVDLISQGGFSKVTPKPFDDMSRYRSAIPTVQCGIVPVDVLEFRKDAFENCIMQRINFNRNVFTYLHLILEDEGPLAASYDRFGQRNISRFNPPCKTRYWETDSVTSGDGEIGCPVRMSIQQCCSILTKDVVPANILKMRTCEGLIQARRNDAMLQSDKYLNGIRKVMRNGMEVEEPDPRTHITMISATHPTTMYDPLLGLKSYGVSMGNETLAKHLTAKLNEITCKGTEPNEYRFENWFPQHVNQELPNPAPIAGACASNLPYRECLHGKKIGSHMPYMRWWDTGASAGNGYIGGNPMNTLGTYDVIVGVGREGREKDAASETEKLYKKLDAPNEVTARVKSEQDSQIGRVGGWSELKAHQMWTIRRNNLSCIGRYEKMFKIGSAENFVLSKAGSGYTSRIGEQWPWPLGWRGYITTPQTGEKFPNFGSTSSLREIKGLDNALPGDIIVYQPRRYPKKPPSSIPASHALGPGEGTPYGLPQIYFVTDIGGYARESGRKYGREGDMPANFDFDEGLFRIGSSGSGGTKLYPTRVYVRSWDQGKFPSATGMSISWGMGPEKTIYRSAVPESYRRDICARTMRALTDHIDTVEEQNRMDYYCRDNMNKEELDEAKCMYEKCQPSCLDSDYSACVLPNGSLDWDQVTIYRPDMDVRECRNPGVAIDSDPPLDLSATYKWESSWTRGSSGEFKLKAPESRVIYQARTRKVPTNLWAWCVNAGFDPPSHFSLEYKGAMTGAITDTTICAPLPYMKDENGKHVEGTGCSTRPGEQHFFFPVSLIR